MKRKNSIAGLAVAAATIGFSLLAAKKLQDDETEIHFLEQNRDESSQAYLLGSGIGNLSLAYFLIHHANLPGENITIFQTQYNPWQCGTHNPPHFHHLESLSPFSLLNAKELFYQIPRENSTLGDLLDLHISTRDAITPLTISLNGEVRKFLQPKVDSLSKSILRKVLLSHDEDFLSRPLDSAFSTTEFLDSELFTYLSGRYDVKKNSPLFLLQESLFHMIIHKNQSPSDEFYFLSHTLEEELICPLVEELKKSKVQFLSDYDWVSFEETDGAISKLILEKENSVEEIFTTKQDIVVLEENYTDEFLEGNLSLEPLKVHRKKTFRTNTLHYELQTLPGTVTEAGMEFVTIAMKDYTFREHLHNRYGRSMDNTELFFETGKAKLLLQIPPRTFCQKGDIFLLKITEPHRHGIFTAKEYRNCTGEEIFYDLIKFLHLEDDFGKLRESVESLTLYYYPNYSFSKATTPYFKNYKNFALLCDSFQSPFYGYSIEKQVFQGMKIAHNMMGITHIEPFMESVPTPVEIFSFLKTLPEN